MDNPPGVIDVARQFLQDHDFHSWHWMLIPQWWSYNFILHPFITLWAIVSVGLLAAVILSLPSLVRGSFFHKDAMNGKTDR